MNYCPCCSAAVAVTSQVHGSLRWECSEDATHNLLTDTPEFCRDHGSRVGSCAGCVAERAEDMGR